MTENESTSSFSPNDISDWFWGIIDRAKRSRDRLADSLSEISKIELIRFHHKFKDAAAQLSDSPFTDHIEDLSDDGIQDVAEWVVSQGKEFYSQVWKNPEMTPKRISKGDSITFTSVADNVFWERYHQSIPIEEN